MNKKGWIRIVEAFVALLLVSGVILIVLSDGLLENEDRSSKIHDAELAVLRDIQVDETLREDILNAPIPIESIDEGFPSDVEDRINLRIPNYLECIAKICEITSECDLDDSPEKSIYVQSVAITTTSGEYKPRQLKLFCWER